MGNGDFVIHADDEMSDVRVEYSEDFEYWFEQTSGKKIPQENLTQWFNDTLREALDQHSESMNDKE